MKLIPPLSKHLERFYTRTLELRKYLQRRDGSDRLDSIRVVAASEHGDQDHTFTTQSEMSGDFGGGEQLAVLVLTEEVLVDALAAEDPDVGVVRYASVGEAVHVQERALGLCFTRRHDPLEEKKRFLL